MFDSLMGQCAQVCHVLLIKYKKSMLSSSTVFWHFFFMEQAAGTASLTLSSIVMHGLTQSWPRRCTGGGLQSNPRRWGGGGGGGGGEKETIPNRTRHHQNDCSWVGNDYSRVNASLTVRGSHKTAVSTNHFVLIQRSRSRIEPKSFCVPA